MHVKTLYRDRTTHLIFALLDFFAHLAAHVPKPRVNFTRFQGALVGTRFKTASARACRHEPQAQRLKRVLRTDIEVCRLLKVGRCYRYIRKADLQIAISAQAEGPQLAVSRRSGDEIHPRPPNGDLRPTPDSRRKICQCLLRRTKRTNDRMVMPKCWTWPEATPASPICAELHSSAPGLLRVGTAYCALWRV